MDDAVDLSADREVCDQCGVLAFPHFRCVCRRCGIRHRKSINICSMSPVALSNREVECSQCGAIAIPHSICRCRLCGIHHSNVTDCRSSQRQRSTSMFKTALNSTLIPPPVHIGDMSITCQFCGARKWPQEKINCCGNGEIQIAPFPDVPAELSSIIYSPHVLENIRSYNMSMAMASVGHSNKSLPDGMFHLGGKSYHMLL